MREDRVREQQVRLDRLGADEGDKRGRQRVAHLRGVQQRYQGIKAKVRNQIEAQKVSLHSQIVAADTACSEVEQENQRLLKGMFHSQVHAGLRQYKPVAQEYKLVTQAGTKKNNGEKNKSFDAFMQKTELSLSQMCREIHDIKDTLQSNLEQMSGGKESRRQDDLEQTVQLRHRQVHPKYSQQLEDAEQQEEDLNGRQNHWLQVAIASKREIRQYQDSIHTVRQEVSDLTEQVRYCQFRYNQEKQRHLEIPLAPENRVKD